MRFHCLPWAAGALSLAAALPVSAVTLYDPGLGTLPSNQNWVTTGLFQNLATESVSGGLYNFSTLASNAIQFGATPGAAIQPTLDTAAGFELDFSLRVVLEDHSSNAQRAGFSVIAVGQDVTHAIELTFWATRVGSYLGFNVPGSTAFSLGPKLDIDTTTQLRNYSLIVQNQNFTLKADGAVLFSGALQDYSPQGLPYNNPSFIFFGDDSSSTRASVQLGAISLGPVPEPAASWLFAAGLAALALGRRRMPRSGS